MYFVLYKVCNRVIDRMLCVLYCTNCVIEYYKELLYKGCFRMAIRNSNVVVYFVFYKL